MEEATNPQNSMGSGQPHQNPINHTRPFFYVQPPSQPFFMYQWHMNGPYAHYGLPGSGLPYGRPYMAPYPYVQYPGYIIPHAPMQPIDYRRMFNQYIPSAAASDVRFRNYHARLRRETACSEAQTEPSDPMNKLNENRNKLETHEAAAERELDSGVISQNSGMFLPGDETKCDRQGEELESTRTKLADASLPSPAVLLRNSGLAIYDAELCQSRLEKQALQDDWHMAAEEMPPLDRSSAHKETQSPKVDELKRQCVPEKLCLSIMSNRCGSIGAENTMAYCSNDQCKRLPPRVMQPEKHVAGPTWPSPERLSAPLPSDWLPDEVFQPGSDEISQEHLLDDPVGEGENPVRDLEDLPYRILRLPYDKMTTAPLLQEQHPLWCVDQMAGLIPPATQLPTFGNAYYSYYAQAAPERQSVLSPSLDELSSRDEIFSTDLEDIDLMPGHVYMGGGRLAEDEMEACDPGSEGDLQDSSSSEECSVCSKRTCASCGSTLSKTTKRTRGHFPETYDYCKKGDTDEEVLEEECCPVARNPEPRKALMKKLGNARRNTHPHGDKQKSKKGHCEDLGESAYLEEQDLDFPALVECCEEHKAMTRAENYKGQELRNAQSRLHLERQWREGEVASDQESWESSGVNQRPKSWKQYPPLRGQEKPSRRRTSCKTPVYQRSRRNDYDDNEEGEFPHFHRGRGAPTGRRLETRQGGSDCGLGRRGVGLACDVQMDLSSGKADRRLGPLSGMWWTLGSGSAAHFEEAGRGEHLTRSMAAPQQAFGTGPRGPNVPHGPAGPQAPPQPAPRPYAPHPEEPPVHHSRPFFYVQPSHPYPPYQWHMPLPYGPYCGFPGFGYGMFMPPFPPNPYMEAPGYIVPHAQIHLADYRRMLNPQFPPTMAYHTRRFRYQQNVAPRETTSSEVQTEPPPIVRSDSQLYTKDSCVGLARSEGLDSGRGTSCTNASTSPVSETQPCLKKVDGPDTGAVSSTCRAAAAAKSAYVFQREEVRIECGGSPSRELKVVHSRETTAESQDTSGNLTQCDVWSVSSAEGVLPLYRSSVHSNDDTHAQEEMCLSGQPEEQCLPSYPDILLMGMSPSGGEEKLAVLEGCDGVTDVVPRADDCNDGGANPLTSVQFKILRLPFEMQYLEDLRKVEESVWSVESLAPYVPSLEWMIEQGLMEAGKATGKSNGDVPVETSTSPVRAASPLENRQDMSVVDRWDGSKLESLLPYLPSGSWLADFGNVYYFSRLPTGDQEHLSSFGASTGQLPAEKKSFDSKSQLAAKAALCRAKEEKHGCLKRSDGKGELNRKDHSSQPPNGISSTPSEGEWRCPRCLAKPDVPAGLTQKASGTRRHRMGPPGMRTCDCGLRKVLKRGDDLKVPGSQNQEEGAMEGEVVENSADLLGKPRRSCELRKSCPSPFSLKRHSEKCSTARRTKLGEKNCACKKPDDDSTREGNWRRHASVVRSCNEENVAVNVPVSDKWKVQERRVAQKRQMEKSWRETVASPDKEISENGARQRNLCRPKKLYAQSQERQHLKESNKPTSQLIQKELWRTNQGVLQPTQMDKRN